MRWVGWNVGGLTFDGNSDLTKDPFFGTGALVVRKGCIFVNAEEYFLLIRLSCKWCQLLQFAYSWFNLCCWETCSFLLTWMLTNWINAIMELHPMFGVIINAPWRVKRRLMIRSRQVFTFDEKQKDQNEVLVPFFIVTKTTLYKATIQTSATQTGGTLQ